MRKFIMMIIIVLTLSCSSVKYIEVPVETIKTEYVDRVTVDSIYVENNTFIKGDTIYKDKYIYKYKYYTDTLRTVDTITVVKEVIKEKEVNRIKDWQLGLMIIGSLTIGGVILYITSKIKR